MSVDTTKFEHKWRVRAEVGTHTYHDGTTADNVIKVVHWHLRVVDTVSGKATERTGTERLPPPSQRAFVDLDRLQGMDYDARRALIFEWANRIDPGFVQRELDAATDRLVQKIDRTARSTQTTVIDL